MQDLLISTLIQGLIYALISFGVYITYSILDFPDLGVDGTFPLGAAITAVLLTRGVNAWLTLPIAILVGTLAGLFTGLIHVRLKIRNLLAGIITMTALFSVNLQIAGSNLAVDRDTDTIFPSPAVMALFGDMTLMGRKLVISLLLLAAVKVLLDLYFKTKSGLLLRAVGDNAGLVTALAKDRGSVKILGLAISNALVAFGGCIVCHETRSFSATMGTGQLVYGLAAVIIGISLFRFYEHSPLARALRKHKGLRWLGAPAGTTAVIVGKRIGEGAGKDEIYSLGCCLLTVSLLVGAVVSLCLAVALPTVFIPYLYPLFHLEGLALRIAVTMCIVYICILPFKAFDITNITGLLRAGGDARMASVIDLVSQWGVAVPLTLLMALVVDAPVTLVCVALQSENFSKMPWGIFRLRSRKWINNVTRGRDA